MCSGAIGITYTTDETPWNYFCFTFFLGGVFATRLWSALLSLELVILLVFGPNFTMLRWLLTLAAGWGLAVVYAHSRVKLMCKKFLLTLYIFTIYPVYLQ